MSIHDSAIDRFRARARCAAVLALLPPTGGTMFAGSISALMRPLITAVTQLETATRPNPR